MPKTNFLSRSGRGSYRDGDGEESSPHVLQVYKDCDSDEEVESTQYGIRDKGHVAKTAGKSKINTEMIPLSATDGPHHSPTGGGAGVKRHDSATLLQTSNCSPSSSLTPAACKGIKVKPNQKPAKKGAITDRDTCTETDCKSFGLRVIAAKRPDSCFFCLKSRPQVLVPACIGWLPHPETAPSDAGI
jgi:hypothetical protein